VKFLQDNWYLVAIAIGSGAGLIWFTVAEKLSGIVKVGVAEAVNLMNRRDAVVLDVRTQGEFAQGHVVNAKHIPVAELKTRLAELDKLKQKPVIVSCASGARALEAAKLLKAGGFTEVFALDGGMHAWTQAAMPLETKKK
jgi:rhodanese-related sulfurtransferase